MYRSAIIAILAATVHISTLLASPNPLLESGFREMYALNFTEAEHSFAEYVRQQPDAPFGYAAQGGCVLFSELERLKLLDAEFYVDDKKLFAEPTGKSDPLAKRRLFELTARARKLADDILRREPANEDALFALAFANGLEADYIFLVDKQYLAAAKPGKAGYEYAKRLLRTNAAFYDAHIWVGMTSYVVASLPFPLRWLARLRGYSGNKQDALTSLQIAAERGSLLRPYAKILLAVTYLREKNKPGAHALLVQLASEFPTNPLFAKHAQRLTPH